MIAPKSDNFYNELYGIDDSARIESTHIFLFAFPVIQICLAVGYLMLPDTRKSSPVSSILVPVGSTLFFIANLFRCMDTWNSIN